VRRGEAPVDIEMVDLPDGVQTPAGIRVDKLAARLGMVDSVTEAARKLKAGALYIDGFRYVELLYPQVQGSFVLQVGKKWKRVRVL